MWSAWGVDCSWTLWQFGYHLVSRPRDAYTGYGCDEIWGRESITIWLKIIVGAIDMVGRVGAHVASWKGLIRRYRKGRKGSGWVVSGEMKDIAEHETLCLTWHGTRPGLMTTRIQWKTLPQVEHQANFSFSALLGTPLPSRMSYLAGLSYPRQLPRSGTSSNSAIKKRVNIWLSN